MPGNAARILVRSYQLSTHSRLILALLARRSGSGASAISVCDAGHYGSQPGQISGDCEGACARKSPFLHKSELAARLLLCGDLCALLTCMCCTALRCVSLLCAEGYWCSASSQSQTQFACGGRSVYCEAGSRAPAPVPNGAVGYGDTPGDEDHNHSLRNW